MKVPGMKKWTLIPLAFLLALLWGMDAPAQGRPTHMDSFKNPRGCAACHAGRGVPGTPMLRRNSQEVCFNCHGPEGRGARTDIESLLSQFSRHPILETAKFHSPGEELPEAQATAPRHVACGDCHSAHLSDENVPWRGARGYVPGQVRGVGGTGGRPVGLRLRLAEEEHELCYLCHADSANLPPDTRNVALEFDPSNASYHPVESDGRNKNVPSLIRSLSVNSRIGCGSCHGNSDPTGTKGPHGSDYSPILVDNYRTEDGPEEPRAYDLCYSCHDRRSVLSDESFKQHNRHIVQAEASCFSCHASHGSRFNTNLIEFNPDVAEPSPTSGGPTFIRGAGGSPQCFLTCHSRTFPEGVIHNSTGVEVPGRGVKSWLVF